MLPDIRGVELLPKLRALPGGAGRPIIACTGFLPRDEEARMTAAGFTEFLIKPVEPSRLREVVRAYTQSSSVSKGKPGRGRRVLAAAADPV